MRSIKLRIAYDGTNYSGWQRQAGQATIQGALEAAWKDVTGEDIPCVGSSRTDAGVHALGQVVSVATESILEPCVLARALNAKLPTEIAVVDAAAAPDGFDAIRDTKSKRYRYQIYNHRRRPVFLREFAWHVPQPLDDGAMQAAANALIGRHDFASFQSAGSERESTVRSIYELCVAPAVAGQGGGENDAATIACSDAPQLLTVEVEGDGFLYNMVRAIVGTLVEVGRGARPVSWVAEVLAARDRSTAGPTAPAHGLFLVKIIYDD